MVEVDEGEAERLAQQQVEEQRREEEYNQLIETNPDSLAALLPFLQMPVDRSPHGYVVIARRRERA